LLQFRLAVGVQFVAQKMTRFSLSLSLSIDYSTSVFELARKNRKIKRESVSGYSHHVQLSDVNTGARIALYENMHDHNINV
jgi:ribosome maturation protein Sdo1